MTDNGAKIITQRKAERASALSALITLAALALTLLLTLLLSEEISDSVRGALELCAGVIVPSVFPFIILSDILYYLVDFSGMRGVGRAFERLFKINRAGLYPFVLGILCGFPLGVKCASELYKDGRISKDECERLIGFCNNTGPAFLVGGIGVGLRGSIFDGAALYLSTVISAIAVGIIFSRGATASADKMGMEARARFSVTASVKSAGTGCLNICSYLTFFACIAGIARAVLGEGIPYLCIIPFLEVGGAADILSKSPLLGSTASLALSAFAVGFSGFSVHLQALSYLSDTNVGVGRYFIMKLIQGLIAAALTAALYILYN